MYVVDDFGHPWKRLDYKLAGIMSRRTAFKVCKRALNYSPEPAELNEAGLCSSNNK